MDHLILVSSALCPYVQRAAVALTEKGVPFVRRTVGLSAKPDWFLAISPLGKTSVLVTDGQPIFESAVILQYLEETEANPLLSADALGRARGWIEVGSAVLADVTQLYNASDEAAFLATVLALKAKFTQVEAAVDEGRWFAGDRFGLGDASFGPVFRSFAVLDALDDFGVLDGLPKVKASRERLATRPSVVGAVADDYPERLLHFRRARGSHLSGLIAAGRGADCPAPPPG